MHQLAQHEQFAVLLEVRKKKEDTKVMHIVDMIWREKLQKISHPAQLT